MEGEGMSELFLEGFALAFKISQRQRDNILLGILLECWFHETYNLHGNGD
jgi:hypothetical protein